jgi:hypothetical protein
MRIEFGDFDNDDALDTAEPDPEQVARKIHRLRLLRNRETIDWDSLSNDDRATLIDIVAHLLAWLKRQGAIR